MKKYVSPANKGHPLSLLEQRALELLQEASPKSKCLPYRDAVCVLTKFRIHRKLAMKLLADFSKRGLLSGSCGHGIRIKGVEE